MVYIKEGNLIYTIDYSGTILNTEPLPVDIGRQYTRLQDRYDVYINYELNILTVKENNETINTFESYDINDLFYTPDYLVVETEEIDGTHVVTLEQDGTEVSDVLVLGDVNILDVYDNGDFLTISNNTISYHNPDGTVDWEYSETMYMPRVYTLINDYIVLEYYKNEVEFNTMYETEHFIDILSKEGELLNSYSFEGLFSYAGKTDDSVIVYFTTKESNPDNGDIIFLDYTNQSSASHSTLYSSHIRYWYIDDTTLYIVSTIPLD